MDSTISARELDLQFHNTDQISSHKFSDIIEDINE